MSVPCSIPSRCQTFAVLVLSFLFTPVVSLSQTKNSPGQIGLSLGLASVQGLRDYAGGRWGLGADIRLSGRYLIGGQLTALTTSEKPELPQSTESRISRYALIPNFGLEFFDSLFWVKAGIGTSVITTHTDGFMTKLKAIKQLRAGVMFPGDQRRWGLELGYEHTSRSSGYIPTIENLFDNFQSVAQEIHVYWIGVSLNFDL